MNVTVASEHIRDGMDCISEAMKTLKRVQKAYPKFAETLVSVQNALENSRKDLLYLHDESFKSPD